MASDETRCYYVSSRGLLKSCDIYPNPPISSCASNVQYLHDFIKQKHKDTDRYRYKNENYLNLCML